MALIINSIATSARSTPTISSIYGAKLPRSMFVCAKRLLLKLEGKTIVDV